MKYLLVIVLLLGSIGLAGWAVLSKLGIALLSDAPASMTSSGASASSAVSSSAASSATGSASTSTTAPRGPVAMLVVNFVRPDWMPSRPGEQPPLDREAFRFVEIHARTHASILASDGLIAQVIADPNSPVRQTKWFASFQDPRKAASWLKKHLVAAPVSDSQVIKVYFDEMPTTSWDESATMLEAIVNRHLELQQAARSNALADRATSLNEVKTRFETRIRELLDRRNERMMQLDMAGTGTTSRYASADSEFQSLLGRQIELESAVAAAQARVEEANQRANDPSFMPEAIDREAIVLKLRERLIDSELSLRAVAATQPADSPAVRDAQRQRDLVNELLEKQRGERRAAMVAADVRDARDRAEAAGRAAAVGQKRIAQLKRQLGDLAIAMSDYQVLDDEIRAGRESLREIKQQLESISSTARDTGVSWAMHPVHTEPAEED